MPVAQQLGRPPLGLRAPSDAPHDPEPRRAHRRERNLLRAARGPPAPRDPARERREEEDRAEVQGDDEREAKVERREGADEEAREEEGAGAQGEGEVCGAGRRARRDE